MEKQKSYKMWHMAVAFVLGVAVVAGVSYGAGALGQGRLFKFSKQSESSSDKQSESSSDQSESSSDQSESSSDQSDFTSSQNEYNNNTINSTCMVETVRDIAEQLSDTRMDYYDNARRSNSFSDTMKSWLTGHFPYILRFEPTPWDASVATSGHDYSAIDFENSSYRELLKSIQRDANTFSKMTESYKDFHDGFINGVLININAIYESILEKLSIDRCEFAFMLYEHSDFAPALPGVPTFEDVDEDMYCYEAVETLYHYGVLNGYGAYFWPNDPILKSHVAKMVTLTFDLPANECAHDDFFEDVPSSEWYYDYVNAAALHGLFCNTDDFGARDCSMPDVFEPYLSIDRDWSLQIMSNTKEVGLRTEFCN